ncbi:MAG TPA: hypothetical protein VGD49_09865 [Longimicrobiales bacterium]
MKRIALPITLLVAIAVGIGFAIERDNGFPHARHAGLFPLCTGCHEGVPEGDSARFYPSADVCIQCHNGVEKQRVDWRTPTAHINNLEFSHPTHDRAQPLECNSCHSREGEAAMAVQRSVVERCLACHAPRAQNHLVDAPCAQCHLTLAQTAFNASRVANLPRPSSHDRPDFLERTHGESARTDRAQCEVCHTRERCAACHVDASQRVEVRAFSPAGPHVELPRFTARYFVPASHLRADWLDQHGGAARTNISTCAGCHTRESCATCHTGSLPRAAAVLPQRAKVSAPGVATVRRAPASHQRAFLGQNHGALAAAKPQTCAGCHTRTECEDCHSANAERVRIVDATHVARAQIKSSALQDTTRRRAAVRHLRAGYHPANFMERHSSPAYNRNLECSNCHDVSRFCRDCHQQRGMGTTGRLEAGFHDAQPAFLLNHGKPARQALESCASCHKQTDCMQCHSSLGALRVSPHGPGFDARRVQQRNARLCFACHLTDPLGRN